MKCAFFLLILLVFVGCNSKEAELGSIQGIRDPNNPIPYITNIVAQGPGTYSVGSGLDFFVTYSEIVIVDGAPRIAISADSGTYYAHYVSGSGTNTLYFHFVVPSGAYDYNGVQLTGLMSLNGGSIYDPDDDDDSSLIYSPPSTTGVLLNGIDPVITSITIDNGYYTPGEELEFTVNYSYPVYVTGTPKLKMGIAAALPEADFVSGSGTTALKFSLNVPAEEDYDGIPVYSPLIISGAMINDYFGDSADLTFINTSFMNVFVDGVVPSENQRVSPANGLRTAGMHLDYSIGFHEIVNVSGIPRIPVVIGSTTRYANYIAGSAGSTLYFRYTIVAGDLDNNGIVSATTLDLNGGSITDRSGNPYSGPALAWPAHSVNVGAAPAVEAAKTVPANGTYIKNNILEFRYNYDKIITVTGGTPHLAIDIGGSVKTVTFDPASSGTTSLVFKYTIAEDDLDTNGVAWVGFSYNSATIKDADNNSISLTGFPSLAGIIVDGDSPVVNVINATMGNYKIDDEISFTVQFDQIVTVTGTPILPLTLGITGKSASYSSGSGTNSLVFKYSVAEGTSDNNGVATNSPLNLSGGTIKDTVGNDAILTFSAGTYGSVIVDAVRPVFTVSAPAPIAWRPMNTMGFTFTASENITVAGGTPTISLSVGTSTKTLTMVSTTANSILFQYVVGATDVDMDGITFTTNAISAAGATIRDSFGNDATLTFTAPAMASVWVVPNEVKQWYDMNSTTTTGMPTTLNNFNPKVGGISPSRTGPVLNLVTGPNGTKFAQFNSSTYYTFTETFDVLIVVLRTPTANGHMFRDTASNQKLTFDYSLGNQIYTGTHCFSSCKFYEPTGPLFTVGVSGEFVAPYTYLQNEVRTIAVDYMDPGVFTYRIGESFNGQIAEIFLLESAGLIPTSIIQDIGTYLNAKHSSSW